MTTKTRVVHCRRDAFDVYIGRSVKRYPEYQPVGWGNPFGSWNSVDPIGDFRADLLRDPARLARLPELRGRRLGCWCAPKGGLPGNLDGHTCHGEVLAALADMTPAQLDELVTAVQTQTPQQPMPRLRLQLKVISLWQPWASLMAAGYKRVETRSWAPRGLTHGQLVAIHAAKRWTDEEQELCLYDPDFRRVLTLATERGLWNIINPPLGCVVAIARFDRAIPTYQFFRSKGAVPVYRLSDDEAAFGNYGPNRYGWVFSEVRPLAPIPLRGQQGIFDWMPAQDELHYLEPRNVAAVAQKPAVLP